MTPTLTFTCSICGESSVSICVYCTKDVCPNHLCDRCRRCSDCCECDIRLDSAREQRPVEPVAIVEPIVEPTPEPAVDPIAEAVEENPEAAPEPPASSDESPGKSGPEA